MYYITNILKNSEGKTNFFSKLYKQFTPPTFAEMLFWFTEALFSNVTMSYIMD